MTTCRSYMVIRVKTRTNRNVKRRLRAFEDGSGIFGAAGVEDVTRRLSAGKDASTYRFEWIILHSAVTYGASPGAEIVARDENGAASPRRRGCSGLLIPVSRPSN